MSVETISKEKTETPVSEFDAFIKKFNLEEAVSDSKDACSRSTDTSWGNCCGQCAHCPLA